MKEKLIKVILKKKEIKFIKKYYKKMKNKLETIIEKEHYVSLKENEVMLMLEIELFGYLYDIFQQKKKQWGEKFTDEIKLLFFKTFFSIIVNLELKENFKNLNEKENIFNKKIQILIEHFKFYCLIKQNLVTLFEEFKGLKKNNKFKIKIESFIKEIHKKDYSLNKEKNFFYSVVEDAIIDDIIKKEKLNNNIKNLFLIEKDKIKKNYFVVYKK